MRMSMFSVCAGIAALAAGVCSFTTMPAGRTLGSQEKTRLRGLGDDDAGWSICAEAEDGGGCEKVFAGGVCDMRLPDEWKCVAGGHRIIRRSTTKTDVKASSSLSCQTQLFTCNLVDVTYKWERKSGSGFFVDNPDDCGMKIVVTKKRDDTTDPSNCKNPPPLIIPKRTE